jgi:hypothetical protein
MKLFRSVVFWLLAILFAGGVAVYQRTTGPTYPVRGTVTLGEEDVSYRLIRSWAGEGDARISVPVERADVMGDVKWKRFKSHDEWLRTPMERTDSGLVFYLPHQPPAGKVMYQISLYHDNRETVLTEEPVIIRFRGEVPSRITILHIVFIFLAFIFSMRAGFEALVKGRYTFAYTVFTVVFLLLGGLVFGPIMQKYAFDAYWTGWPSGHDLTDNKTAVAFLFWCIAMAAQWRNRQSRSWAAIAALVLLAVYLIPHSLMGSELDFRETEGEVEIEMTH